MSSSRGFSPGSAALGLLALAATAAAQEDSGFCLSLAGEGEEQRCALEGEVRVPGGTEFLVALELDGTPVAVRRVRSRDGWVRAAFPIRGVDLLPGVYIARVRLVDPAPQAAEAVAVLRVGSFAEETAIREESSRWLESCARRLLSLCRELARSAHGDGKGEDRVAWDRAFLSLGREIDDAVAPDVYFALYRADEVRELVVYRAALLILETERREHPSRSSEESSLAALYLGEIERRLSVLANDVERPGEPARAALSRWLLAVKALPVEGPREADLAALERIDLSGSENLPGFERLAGARRNAMQGLGSLVSPEIGGRVGAVREAIEEAVAEIETMLYEDRQAARARLGGPLGSIEAGAAALGRGENLRPSQLEEIESGVEALRIDGGAMFHFEGFVVRARSGAACLREIQRLSDPTAPPIPREKRDERKAYFLRTLQDLLGDLRKAVE